MIKLITLHLILAVLLIESRKHMTLVICSCCFANIVTNITCTWSDLPVDGDRSLVVGSH